MRVRRYAALKLSFARKRIHVAVRVLILLSLVVSQRQLSNLSSSQKDFEKLKVLVYMTTNLGENQIKYFPCWHHASRHLRLFRQADLLLYTSVAPTPQILKSLRRFRKVRVEYFNDGGYQQGAIQAMLDPFKHNWFEGYDWVIRLNPDVLIRDDTWFRQIMVNESVIKRNMRDCQAL